MAAGAALTNDGTVTAASTLQFSGTVTNATDGTIAAEGASLSLDGNARLTNDGAIDVGPVSSGFSAGSAGTVYNREGTISDGARSRCPLAQPSSRAPVRRAAALSRLEEYCAWRAAGHPNSSCSAAIPRGPSSLGTLPVGRPSGCTGQASPPRAPPVASPTTARLLAAATSSCPPGATLTNKGALDVGHGGGGSLGFTLEGNLVNAPSGVIGQNFGGIMMAANDTSLVNQGTLEMLFPEGYDLGGVPESNAKREIIFHNTGTMYLGVGGDAAWGGAADASQIGGTTGDTVDIGGTVVPVPTDEPSPGLTPGGKHITYGITGGRFVGGRPMWPRPARQR